ncbi:MAG: DNA-processing protein DprA [Patescibacteria group bacterium]
MIVNKLKLNSQLYQKYFANITDPPKQLFYNGSVDKLADYPKVAIVGSRKVSAYGRIITEKLASQLASGGAIIISGLALGVDSLAHKACLDSSGVTVAVLPSAVTQIYPASHHSLASQILAKGGALLSEYSGNDLPQKYQFIARNRLIAAMADVVLITEAAERSGSLHTANFALEQGKTVMAVPGNITSPNSAGTNQLIKSGAIPVTSVDDIWQALGVSPNTQKAAILGDDEQEAVIISLLAQGINDGVELLEKSQLETRVFNQTITMLEISGKIRPLGGGNWTLS